MTESIDLEDLMNGIDFWRLSDELTIIQAALLICGIDPAGKEHSIERQSKRPRGYDAIKHALLISYNNKSLIGKEVRQYDVLAKARRPVMI